MVRHAIILLLVVAGTARAADDIETDRPDQTETATTVPAGAVQIEAGVVYEYDEVRYPDPWEREVELTTIVMPGVLIRAGVVDGFELRVEAAWHRTEQALYDIAPWPKTKITGFAAPSVGIKAELIEEAGWIPQTAIIADVTLPVGHEKLRTEYVAPAFRFSMAHSLSETFSLGYNVGGEWDGETAAGTGIYTLTVGAALAENIGAYIEVFGELPAGSTPSHMLDGGVVYRLFPNLQFDVSGGIALNEAAPDYFLSAGASIRLPE